MDERKNTSARKYNTLVKMMLNYLGETDSFYKVKIDMTKNLYGMITSDL